MILRSQPPPGSVNVQAIVIGKKGSGKTVFLCDVAEHNTRVLFIDPVGTAPCKGVVMSSLQEVYSHIENNMSGRFRIVYRPQADEDVNELFGLVYELGNIVLIVDEVDVYMNSQVTSDEAKRVFRYGRHTNVAFFGATRRPFSIPREVTALSEYAVVMRLTEPRDVKYVKEWIHWEGKDIEAEMRKIPQWHALFTNFADEPTVQSLTSIAPSFYNLLSVSVERRRPVS